MLSRVFPLLSLTAYPLLSRGRPSASFFVLPQRLQNTLSAAQDIPIKFHYLKRCKKVLAPRDDVSFKAVQRTFEEEMFGRRLPEIDVAYKLKRHEELHILDDLDKPISELLDGRESVDVYVSHVDTFAFTLAEVDPDFGEVKERRYYGRDAFIRENIDVTFIAFDASALVAEEVFQNAFDGVLASNKFIKAPRDSEDTRSHEQIVSDVWEQECQHYIEEKHKLIRH